MDGCAKLLVGADLMVLSLTMVHESLHGVQETSTWMGFEIGLLLVCMTIVLVWIATMCVYQSLMSSSARPRRLP